MRARKGTIEKQANTTKMATAMVHGISDELDSGVEKYGTYGLTSWPRNINPDGKGAEVVLLDLLDANTNVIVADDDRRYRPVVGNEGDVQLYSHHDNPTADADDAVSRLTLTDDGTDDEYRLIAKVNNCTLEMKSTNDIRIQNENASIVLLANGNITINGAAMTINVASLDINEA